MPPRTVIFFAVAIAAAQSASASAIVIGSRDGNTCYPFSCGSNGEYQQIYLSSAFTAPFSISSIAFASGSPYPNIAKSLNVEIGLSTSSAAALSNSYLANRGSNFTIVYSGSRTFVSSGTDTFDLIFNTSPFLYNPALGNLLLDIKVNAVSNAIIAFNETDTPLTSRLIDLGFPFVSPSSGLLTSFGVGPQIVAVPETSTSTMLSVGIILLFLRYVICRAHVPAVALEGDRL